MERCVLALAAEGKRLLDEGIAQLMSDIDAVYVNGYGFPRAQGGPMFQAEQMGWARLEDKLRAFAADTTLQKSFWIAD